MILAVMAGHSRSQNGVASLAYAGHPRLHFGGLKDVGARHKAGHDDYWFVIAGLDPAIHAERQRTMDCRIKPSGDQSWVCPVSVGFAALSPPYVLRPKRSALEAAAD